MSFLKSYPATSILIAVFTFAAVGVWVLRRRLSRPGTDVKTPARFGFAGGIVLIVVGLITTGINIAQGRWTVDYFVLLGLVACWLAHSIQRTTPHSSQSRPAETPSFPER